MAQSQDVILDNNHSFAKLKTAIHETLFDDDWCRSPELERLLDTAIIQEKSTLSDQAPGKFLTGESEILEETTWGNSQDVPKVYQRIYDSLDDAIAFKQWVENSRNNADISLGLMRNLPLLTAVRCNGLDPDPLEICVDAGEQLTCSRFDMPSLKVTCRNVDIGKRPFGIQNGGDYRSGRFDRLAIVESGDLNRFSARPRKSRMRGGQSFEKLLFHGNSVEYSIDLQDYIVAPKPGCYKMCVAYHDACEISAVVHEDQLSNRPTASRTASRDGFAGSDLVFGFHNR